MNESIMRDKARWWRSLKELSPLLLTAFEQNEWLAVLSDSDRPEKACFAELAKWRPELLDNAALDLESPELAFIAQEPLAKSLQNIRSNLISLITATVRVLDDPSMLTTAERMMVWLLQEISFERLVPAEYGEEGWHLYLMYGVDQCGRFKAPGDVSMTEAVSLLEQALAVDKLNVEGEERVAAKNLLVSLAPAIRYFKGMIEEAIAINSKET